MDENWLPPCGRGRPWMKEKNGIILVTMKVNMKTITGTFLVIEMLCATRMTLLERGGAQRKREKKMKKSKM
jgi:hypothetical protein